MQKDACHIPGKNSAIQRRTLGTTLPGPPADPLPPAGGPHHVKRVLIIDKDQAVRQSLQRLLLSSEYHPVLASDAREALTALRIQTIDLVLLDLDLPELSGWDVLDRVARKYPGLPIVIFTGYLGDCEPGALSLVRAAFGKPPDVQELLDVIEELLRSHQPKPVSSPVPEPDTQPAQFGLMAGPPGWRAGL
jgi:DNA-binding NtrC family response regulator